jgi:hypothetical protein
MMLTRGVLTSGKEIPYALGLFHGEYRGLKTVHHGGAWGGFRAQLVRVPEQRFSAVVLCNLGSSGPDKRAYQILDIFLAEHLEPVEEKAAAAAVSLDPEALEEFVGEYQLEIGLLFKVGEENGSLFMEAGGMPRMELVPVSDTEFMVSELDARFSFHTDEAGRVARVIAHLGSDEISGTRLDGYVPTPRQVAEYAGNYHSDELDTVWRLVEADGGLELQVGFTSKFELQFTAEDTFAADRFSGTFERGADGTVAAVVLNAGRVKNLRAVKQ